MKIRKTSNKQRSTYTYTFIDAKGRTEKVILRPGEKGVTEADIKTLHSFDDSEVYYNNKNLRPNRTEEEKAEIEIWKENYIKKETKRCGYAPTDKEVEYAVEERFPKNYNLSLDYIFGDEEADTDLDKNKLLYELSEKQIHDESEETLKVRELMSKMTEKQKTVLSKVEFEGYSLTDVAKEWGTSVANIKKHYDKAIDFIRKNYKK